MKLGIFHFWTVRGFDVLQFEAKQPGRKISFYGKSKINCREL